MARGTKKIFYAGLLLGGAVLLAVNINPVLDVMAIAVIFWTLYEISKLERLRKKQVPQLRRNPHRFRPFE